MSYETNFKSLLDSQQQEGPAASMFFGTSADAFFGSNNISNSSAGGDLPPYWQLAPTDHMINNSKLTLAAGILSLVASTFVACLYLYAMIGPGRDNPRLATIVGPHNHFVFLIQICGIIMSLVFILTSSLRMSDHLKWSWRWCDPSATLIQIFGVASTILELAFLLSLLVTMFRPQWLPRYYHHKGRSGKDRDDDDIVEGVMGLPPFCFYASCFAFMFGSLSSVLCNALLPVNPSWGTRYDPQLEAWCWIPASLPGDPGDVPGMVAVQFLAFFVWVFMVPIAGIVAFVAAYQQIGPHAQAGVHWFLFSRLAYAISFVVMWTFPLASRLSNNPKSQIHNAQAFSEPAVPLVNALIFLMSEVFPRIFTSWFSSREDDLMNDDERTSLINGNRSYRHMMGRGENGDDDDDNDDAHTADRVASSVGQLSSSAAAAGGADNSSTNLIIDQHRRTTSYMSDDDAMMGNTESTSVFQLAEAFGVAGFAHAASLTQALQVQQVDVVDREAVDRAIKVIFDEQNQSFIVEVDPSYPNMITASQVLASISEINFIEMDRWMLSAYFALLCGFSDLTGAVLCDFLTAHITGNIVSVALWFAGKSTAVDLYRHGPGYFVYFAGCAVANEIVRRNNKPNGARGLLFVHTITMFMSYITACLHEDIGSDKWRASSASYLSTFLMVFSLAQLNVFQKYFLVGLPMTTFMTGNTTTLTGDVMICLFAMPQTKEARIAQLQKTRNSTVNIILFTLGGICTCVAAKHRPDLCFSVPAMMSLVGLWIAWGTLRKMQ